MFEVFRKKNKEGTLSFNAISANYNLCAFGQVTYSLCTLLSSYFYVPVNPEIIQFKVGMS